MYESDAVEKKYPLCVENPSCMALLLARALEGFCVGFGENAHFERIA
jgi:hypothetical protein